MLTPETMRSEFPDFKLVPKDREHVPTWLWAFFVVAGWFNKDFFTRYATVVGCTVYMATERSDKPRSIANLLRHERVHMRDSRGLRGLLYYLTYLFCFPAALTMRAYWEYRGYAQTLLCWYEQEGKITDEDLDWLVGVFTGPGYLYMVWPFGSWLRAKLARLRERIVAGEVSGPNWPHASAGVLPPPEVLVAVPQPVGNAVPHLGRPWVELGGVDGLEAVLAE